MKKSSPHSINFYLNPYLLLTKLRQSSPHHILLASYLHFGISSSKTRQGNRDTSKIFSSLLRNLAPLCICQDKLLNNRAEYNQNSLYFNKPK